jgi:hypothetical protein
MWDDRKIIIKKMTFSIKTSRKQRHSLSSAFYFTLIKMLTGPKRLDDKSKYFKLLFCIITPDKSAAVGSVILLLAKFNRIKLEFFNKAFAFIVNIINLS